MTTLQYESPAEREMSIARATELRDAVDAYRASCVTRFPEEKSQSDEWFACRGVEPTPLREPSKMFTAADKRWLKEHEDDLSKEDDGRESHLTLYREFFKESAPENPDDNDGVDFAPPLEEPSSSFSENRLQEEHATEKSIDTTRDPDEADPKPQDIVSNEIMSGALASSWWSKVERVLASGLYGKALTYDEDMRLRDRGFTKTKPRWRKELSKRNRVETPKYLMHAATKNAFDAVKKEFGAYLFFEFNPHVPALHLISHKTAHKSRVDFTGHIIMDAEMLPGKPLLYPKDEIREWSGDKNDPAFRLWLDSGLPSASLQRKAIWKRRRPLRQKDARFRIIIPPHERLTAPLRGTSFAPDPTYRFTDIESILNRHGWRTSPSGMVEYEGRC